MGWWWNSTAAKNEPADKQQPTVDSEAAVPIEQRRLSSPIVEESTRTLTREEQSNQELIKFLKELQAQADEKKAQELKSKPLSEGLSASTPTTLSPDDISPDSLYPTEIHCRSAFDYAFFCQSFGGQFVNIYRYGGFRSCSNHWEDFWLCMRTRNWDEKDRAKAIKDHYKQKTIKYKTGLSSEDVWDVRVEPVKDAFQGNLEALEERIEAWKKANPSAEHAWLKAT